MRISSPPFTKCALVVLALCLSTAALADDIIIPTTAEHPFDLTQGELTGNGIRVNATSSELENMRNGAMGTLAFRNSSGLKPGDEVPIVNPEFDNGYTGWEYKGNSFGKNTSSLFGNNCARLWQLGHLQQTVSGLPNGTYLLQVCAYDGEDWDGVGEFGSYVFLNGSYQTMKHANDDAVGYRNIYRVCDGQQKNDYYRHSPDGRFVPTHKEEWNEALAMAEGLYVNSVVAAVTDGKATFGLSITHNRWTMVTCDHFRLVYLSDKTDLSAEQCAALAREETTKAYQARLDIQLSSLKALLNNGQHHAPKAVSEANDIIVTDGHGMTRNELIDAILHAEHTVQRLQLPFYDITLSSPGTLADQLANKSIQAADTIALKLSGTLNDADFTTLKTLTNLMELDLSETTLTALPDNQFEERRRLTWVTLPNGLQTIGTSAFSGCYRLHEVALPATLRSIGVYAFHSCYNLGRAVIPEGVTVGDYGYIYSGIRSIVLPASMKAIPLKMCAGCQDLTDIQFNDQVVIGDCAFENCYQLKNVNLPEGLKWMGSQCFRYCTGLTTITLPGSVQNAISPFFNCSNLKEVTCLAIAPPHLQYRLHGDMSDEGTILRVPKVSLAAYQEANLWKDCTIEGIDTLPSTLSVIAPVTLDTSDGLPAGYKPDVYIGVMTSLFESSLGADYNNGKLTVNGPTMLSTRNFTQIYDNYSSEGHYDGVGFNTYYGSLLVNGQMRADSVTIDLHLYPNQWQYMSFPFDVRLSDLDILVSNKHQHFGVAPLVIYGHNGTKRSEGKLDEVWVRMTADSTLHAGQGYIWQTPLNMAPAKGDLLSNRIYVHAAQNATKPLFFRSGDVEVKLQKYYSEFAHNRSWNFVGNPYPCYYDISYMETTAPIIVWERNSSSGGNYRAFSPLDDLYNLHPGQAFFIQRPLDQESVIFNREGRRNSLDIILQGTARPAKARVANAQPRQVFNLLISGNSGDSGKSGNSGDSGHLDRTRFVINEVASIDYEPGRDANKFAPHDANTAQFYTVYDGVRYAIDERPFADGTVRLGLQLPTAGIYTISLSVPSGFPAGITLIDCETDTETDLTNSSYTFQAKAGTTEGRFLVRLGGAITAVPYAETLLQQSEQLYDLQGRRVSQPQPGIYVRNNKMVIIK